MRFLVTFLSLLSIASVSVAATATCEVGVFVASNTGLLPSKETVKVTTQVQSKEKFSNQNCTEQKVINGFDAKVCFVESEIVGGYSAALQFSRGGLNEPTGTWTDFGTSRTTRKLVVLNEVKKIITEFQTAVSSYNQFERLNGMPETNLPEELGNYTSQADMAVEEVVKRDLYKAGEPVVVSIKDCEINK